MVGEIWTIEERFWSGGVHHYRAAMHPECVMAFQAPVGILAGPQIIESIESAPRWASLRMSERQMVHPVPDVVILAYQAEATRPDVPPYSAYCTSTYVRTGDEWRLVQHQHSPA